MGSRCSSIVRAFAHGVMGRLINPSWWTHLCGIMHIKEPLLLIGKNSPCGDSGFSLLLSEWSFIICNFLSCSIYKVKAIKYRGSIQMLILYQLQSIKEHLLPEMFVCNIYHLFFHIYCIYACNYVVCVCVLVLVCVCVCVCVCFLSF